MFTNLLIFFVACGTPIPQTRSSSSGTFGADSSSGLSEVSEMEGDIFTEGTAVEIDVHELVNLHRTEQEINDLVHHSQLMHLARLHSEAMALGELSFGHGGFDERYDEIVSDFDFSVVRVAENVGYAGPSNAGEDVVANWLDSEGHRSNIEGPYHYSGIGSYSHDSRVYVTQIFVQVR